METTVTSFIRIMNFILEQIESIIPYNLPLARIREKAAGFFVFADLQV